jgi:hypothetical protein
VEESYKSFHQEGIIIVQAINNFFEEALGFRVSSEYGGRHSTAEEEQHSSPQWDVGHTKLGCEVHRTSRMYGGAARPTWTLNTIAQPPYTPWYSEYGFIFMTEEKEKKLT